MKQKVHYLRVKHTGQIIRRDTRDRWEREADAAMVERARKPLKKPRVRRTRHNSRKKRKIRLQIEQIHELGMLPVGKSQSKILKGLAEGKSHDEIMASLDRPVRRSFVNKKRAERSRKHRQARIARKAHEHTIQLAARVRNWFSNHGR